MTLITSENLFRRIVFQVDMPGFVGHSLLVHQMDNQTKGFDLMLSFRTSTPDGLLFYTGDSRVE